MESSICKAVVLAAGRGTRLGALTAERPKPMIAVAGRPALEHTLAAIRDAGIGEAMLVVGYREEAIRSYFGDGRRVGIRIAYARQEAPNGTGAALLLGRDFAGGGPFLSVYGDIQTDPRHYRALCAEYERTPCDAALGINPVDDPFAGAAVYREGGRITRVVEKPPPGAAGTKWNLAGINAFGPDVFAALERVSPSPRGEIELTSGIAALIESGREVRACELRGYWSDIGTPEALAAAERDWPGVLAAQI